jgi:hypothetical protein
MLIISAGLLIWLVRFGPETPSPPDTTSIKEVYQLKPGPDDLQSDAKSGESSTFIISISPVSEGSRGQSRQNPLLSVRDRRETIELKLKLTGRPYPQYRSRVQRLNSPEEIASVDSLIPESRDGQKIVVWRVNRARLSVGDYRVEFQGRTANGAPGETILYDLHMRAQ